MGILWLEKLSLYNAMGLWIPLQHNTMPYIANFIQRVNIINHEAGMYRKISNMSHTKSPNLNVPRLVLQLSLPNQMKPSVKSGMKM